MAQRRDHPYVWVTWLSKVMAGDTSCLWAPWFRSHHQHYQKLESDLDIARWNVEHTRLLTETRAGLERSGAHVRVEGQNSFTYRHASGGVLAGKPDLVSLSDGIATVSDCKTGKPRTSDRVQVMIYMFILPYCRPELALYRFEGRLVYGNQVVTVPATAVDDRFGDHLDFFMNMIVSAAPPAPSPSPSECRFCDIGEAECPVRYRRT